MTRTFDIKWNFVTARMGANFVCNRAARRAFSKKIDRKAFSIICNYGWVVKFMWLNYKLQSKSDFVIITSVVDKHNNGCDPY